MARPPPRLVQRAPGRKLRGHGLSLYRPRRACVEVRFWRSTSAAACAAVARASSTLDASSALSRPISCTHMRRRRFWVHGN